MVNVDYKEALKIYSNWSDAYLIEMRRQYKEMYQSARNQDDGERMQVFEQRLRAIEDLLCKNVKRCVKCNAAIAPDETQLLGEERCATCAD